MQSCCRWLGRLSSVSISINVNRYYRDQVDILM